jgi:hypothetical protein
VIIDGVDYAGEAMIVALGVTEQGDGAIQQERLACTVEWNCRDNFSRGRAGGQAARAGRPLLHAVDRPAPAQ